MGKVLLDMSISLDGYIATSNDEDGGLHDWYFAPAAPSVEVIDEVINESGVILMGRRSYEMGNEFDGYEDNPYKMPHIILTHQAPQQLPKGDTTFIFVTDGIESAIKQAQALAGDKYVTVGGGASTAQQLLKAGLIDEIQLHLVPVLFGGGLRLFENIGHVELERTRVIASEGVTHIKFRRS